MKRLNIQLFALQRQYFAIFFEHTIKWILIIELEDKERNRRIRKSGISVDHRSNTSGSEITGRVASRVANRGATRSRIKAESTRESQIDASISSASPLFKSHLDTCPRLIDFLVTSSFVLSKITIPLKNSSIINNK